MNAPGANVGATRANDFPRQANRYGQADSDLPSMRTDPDKAERLTGIYGSVSVVPGGLGGLPPGSGSAIPGDSLRIWPRFCVLFV